MNRTALVSAALLLSVSLNAGLLALARREPAPEPAPPPPAPAPAAPAPAPEPLPALIKFEPSPEIPIILDATPAFRIDTDLRLGEIVVTTTAFDRNDRLRSRATG